MNRGYSLYARIQGGLLGHRNPPPPTAVCNFFLLVDLPRALQQFGSPPEIPVRTPPPPSECTKPPLLNPGSAPGLTLRMVSYKSKSYIVDPSLCGVCEQPRSELWSMDSVTPRHCPNTHIPYPRALQNVLYFVMYGPLRRTGAVVVAVVVVEGGGAV